MFQAEIKKCQNCKKEFIVEPEDFDFYQKIKVPPPTFCPECRFRRKLVFRNLRSLHKHKCNAPGHNEELISLYAPNAPVVVYDQKYWWSDAWNAMDYGKEYDFSLSFFDQYKELMHSVPWPNVMVTNSVGSEYCNSVLNMKNCFLVFAAINSEDCAYCEQIEFTKNSFDLKRGHQNEYCYELLGCNNCYKTFFGAYSEECFDCWFIWDCRGCTNCFGCVGLRNKSYYIFNKPYTKEEYLRKVETFSLGSYNKLSQIKTDFEERRLKFPYKYARILRSQNVSGDNLKNARNCHNCFEAFGQGIEDCRYVLHSYDKLVRDSHSVFTIGTGELAYDSISIRDCNRVSFSKKIWTGYDVQYSYNCHNCNNILGCIGLRNKKYCILNKQYSEKEYEEIREKIIAHMKTVPYMDAKGREYRYGEFFPPELSLFAYNETIAQEYFPLTKEQAIEQGYSWKEPEERNIQFSISNSQLPDNIKDVKDDIIGQIIECAHQGKCQEQCTTAFKIIEPELQFYRRMNLPLPRLCPNCRHYQRLKQRNPLKLWHRKCQCAGNQSENGVYKNTIKHFHGTEPCPNEFETTYSPERKEIVYCEKCYLSEVV